MMDPSLRLSCEELLELPYFQEEGGANWGRDGERPGRRHDKGSRRRQAGVGMKQEIETEIIIEIRNHPLTPNLSSRVHSAVATHVYHAVSFPLLGLTWSLRL